MRPGRVLRLVVLAVVAVASEGCAVATKPMPEVTGRLALKVSASVYVSGHQGGRISECCSAPVPLPGENVELMAVPTSSVATTGEPGTSKAARRSATQLEWMSR